MQKNSGQGLFLAGKDGKGGGETCGPLIDEGGPLVGVGVDLGGHAGGGGGRTVE